MVRYVNDRVIMYCTIGWYILNFQLIRTLIHNVIRFVRSLIIVYFMILILTLYRNR